MKNLYGMVIIRKIEAGEIEIVSAFFNSLTEKVLDIASKRFSLSKDEMLKKVKEDPTIYVYSFERYGGEIVFEIIKSIFYVKDNDFRFISDSINDLFKNDYKFVNFIG